jgi:hypothetical protein
VQDRDGERVFGRTVDCLSDDVSGLVAVEGRAEDLDLEIDLAARHAVQEAVHRHVDMFDIALQVGERTVPVEIRDDLAHGAAQAIFLGVIAAVGLAVVAFEIFGRNGRADENEIVVEIIPVQDLGRHRVEEGFGQLRLLVVEQEPDIEQLDLLPGRVVDARRIEFVAQALYALVDAVVVETDAFLDGLVHAQPVTVLEARLGFAAGLAEQRVVFIEPLNHGQRDLVRVGAIEAD